MSALNRPTLPPAREWVGIALVLAVGVGLAAVEHALRLEQAILFETVHMLVVAAVFALCLVAQVRHPEIRHFGWWKIVWGVGFLFIGSVVDILDDAIVISALNQVGVPLYRGVGLAFGEKILGSTSGIILLALGFTQWVPWMIQTRTNVERLNQRMAQSNKTLSTLMMSLDEHIESVRLHISRELHDDVAQQLTYLKVQLQLCEKMLLQDSEKARERLLTLGEEVSETLRSVRQISRDLRPEALYALGLLPELEQFLEKTRLQYPDVILTLESRLGGENGGPRIETLLDDQRLLHLFRVLQEGTRNALKHSGASEIRLILLEASACFRFRIEDNGRGLPWPEAPPDEQLIQQGHLGIAGLRERVRELSGALRLKNRADGPGTILEVELVK